MRNKKIGDVVRELRQKISVTQQQLAVMMDASVSAIAGYEQGANPSVGALKNLRDIARKHHQDELAEIFEVHRLVNAGETLPGFRRLANRYRTGHDLQDLAVALAIEISRDPERVSALLKFAKPEIERLQAEEKQVQTELLKRIKDLRAK